MEEVTSKILFGQTHSLVSTIFAIKFTWKISSPMEKIEGNEKN
jgi:hypothetical protein